MASIKATEGAFFAAFTRDIRMTNRSSREDPANRIGITHQAHVMALLRAEENPIIRVCRNLLENNCSNDCMHKRRIKVSVFKKALRVSQGIFGDSKQSCERCDIASRVSFSRPASSAVE